MIIDCFIFFNELKMLKFRLEELYEHVDYFVIVESSKTFTNKPKPLFFHENRILFEKYLNKIIYHVIDFPVNFLDNEWEREFYQRDSIIFGLDKVPNIKNDDLVIISDVDEIPDITSIKKTNINDLMFGCHLVQDFYYYNLNLCKNRKWNWSVILPFSKVKNIKISEVRKSHPNMSGINPGGWHFSYFGDTKNIINKINSFSHQEYNNDYYKDEERILKCISNGLDIFEREVSEDEKLIFKDFIDNDYLPKNYRMLL